jgi:FKBP-type peptidyl-prolyl cis-trans isomerase
MKKAIIFLILLALALAGYHSATSKKQETKQENIMPELKIEILKEGTGEEIQNGRTATVHYTGTLTDGTKFDSSLDRNQPFSFVLGAGRVIQGWDQGVRGMKAGEKRKLTIPPDLGYGSSAVGPIPANSTLIFEVELLSIQ